MGVQACKCMNRTRVNLEWIIQSQANVRAQICSQKDLSGPLPPQHIRLREQPAEGGRTPSIWDDFCKRTECMACADVGNDMYHKYKEDIQMMKGLDLVQLLDGV